MDEVKKILQKAYDEGMSDTELEKELESLPLGELSDFIIWHFNRGKFNIE